MLRSSALFLIISAVYGASAFNDPESRIIGGQDANEGEFPYMASIRRRYSDPGHICAATVLTSKWILTAAHCCFSIRDPERVYIYAGSIYLSRNGTEHGIDKIIMHEDYAADAGRQNDICLIKVKEQFALGKNVAQVTLPPSVFLVETGDKVTLIGWGRTKPNSEECPDRLQKSDEYVALTNKDCRAMVALKDFDGYICAKGNRKELSTWNGDSGNPMVRQGVQVGLVSFGFPYGKGFPAVCCRTSHYIDWIKEQLGPDAKQLKIHK